jgi:translation elongation factor EF-1alpha
MSTNFFVQQIKRSHIRKGMVMVSPKLDPKACWEFEGEILVLHHPTTMSVKYQAMGQLALHIVRYASSQLITFSARWKCPANSNHHQDVQRTSANGRQSHRPFPLHQKP